MSSVGGAGEDSPVTVGDPPRVRPSRRYLWTKIGIEAVVAIVIMAMLLFSASEIHWRTEPLAISQFIPESQSIAVDASGYLHISWGGLSDGLYLTTNQGGQWTTARVTSERASHTSISIGADGVIHIAFVSESLRGVGVLKYARGTAGSWDIIDVDPEMTGVPLMLGPPFSLAVGSDGSAHIVYSKIWPGVPGYYSGISSLMYATNRGGSWSTAVVREYVYNYSQPSWVGVVALDSDGNPHVAANYNTYQVRSYEMATTGSWTEQNVTNYSIAIRITSGVSLAVGPDDAIHLAYFGLLPAEGLIHSGRASGSSEWRTERVLNISSFGRCSIVLNPGDKLQIAYVAETGPPATFDQYQIGRVVSSDGQSWKNEAILRISSFYDFSFAADANGKDWITMPGLAVCTNELSFGEKLGTLNPLVQLSIIASGLAAIMAAANLWRLRDAE